MSDTAIGFLIVGIGMLVVLGVVFAISSRRGPHEPRPASAEGVHLPAAELPAGGPVGRCRAASGPGFVFRREDQLANLFLAIPGLVIFVLGCVWWVRAADREWREVESGGSHGESHADEH